VLEETNDREEIIERVAALDIGKAELVCCVRVPGVEGKSRRVQEVTTYQTMTRALLGMIDRLIELGVTRVVMEATSDYWKPPVRHEALWNRVEVRRLRRWPVAAGQ
jgi:transposase